MEKISYKLPSFEGPLDLLLYLISKNKLNIYDIQISTLLDQYMEHIKAMQEQDMDVASEFLEMAASLVQIKTASLLPKHQEAEELKEDLTGQLLEYQECKRVAQMMAQEMHFDIFTREPLELEWDMTYQRRHHPQELIEGYLSAAGRGKRKLPPPPEAFSALVTRRVVSVASRIIHVLRSLWKKEEVPFDSLFEYSEEKSELVATFLAVLELVKGKRVRIEQQCGETRVKLINGGGKHWKSNNFKRP